MKKTALVLSGGGSRGAYEIGVWKALKELKIKIHMVMGTSVGAINSAMIAQGDLQLCEMLWKQLETEMVFDVAGSERPTKQAPNNDSGLPKALSSQMQATEAKANSPQTEPQIKQPGKKLSIELQQVQQTLKEKLASMDIGGMPAEDALTYAKEIVMSGGAGSSGLRNLLESYIDEQEIRNSQMQYGLVTTEYPSLEGHFLYLDDIPQDKLTDYIIASASCFPAVQKCRIDDKQFIDGGYRDNLPVEMALRQGATSIIAVDLQAAGFVRKNTLETAKKTTEEFHLIRSPFDLGNFLIFDKLNSARIMTLGYLDTMREFGNYDGQAYTFEKDKFTSHELLGAEAAAAIIGLDETKIYGKASLNEALLASLPASAKNAKGASCAKTAASGSPGDQGAANKITAADIKKLLARLATASADTGMHTQLLLHITCSLKSEKENSPFLQPKLFKLLEREVQAANYLLQQGLV